jgi:CRISPR-associated protein Cas1
VQPRVIDLSEKPARLSVRIGNLVVENREVDTCLTIPLPEIAVLVAAHPQVSMTHAALSGICAAGGAVVVCDDKQLPVGMMLPLAGHSVQVERLAAQATAGQPLRKQLWKQIVVAKVNAQSRLLNELYGNDGGIGDLAPRVRSGDTANIESQAARRYWPRLFADPKFRRNREAEDQNRLLNYGYAIMRAIIARAICAAGLHPSLGIHHHNRYDAFCLADDLLEPYRPLVDRSVVALVKEQGKDAPLDRDAKTRILGSILARHNFKGESRTLFDYFGQTCSSLVEVFTGSAKTIYLPAL